MPDRNNSLYNSQGGRGSNQNGSGGNGDGGNENTWNQNTLPNAKSSTNPKSSTNSNLSLGGHSDVVNSLLSRAGDTNPNSTSNRSNSTNSDTHTQSEQARIQAEAALKGVRENNNRQRDERTSAISSISTPKVLHEIQFASPFWARCNDTHASSLQFMYWVLHYQNTKLIYI